MPHPEFEWALYDIGGVIGFAAYLSIAWHMMHVLRWRQTRLAARRRRRYLKRQAASVASSAGSSKTGGSELYSSVASTATLAPMQRGQLCRCNTVVFTSGIAVTASASLFMVAYLSMCVVWWWRWHVGGVTTHQVSHPSNVFRCARRVLTGTPSCF